MVDRLAPHFHREPAWAEDWSVAMFSSTTEARINDGVPIESDISDVLVSFAEPFATELTRIFLDLAGVDAPAEELDLCSGVNWLRFTRSRPTGVDRTPDMLICRIDDPTKVVLVIELKGRAQVNGGGLYCSGAHESLGYSSQAVCYLEGCWTTLDLDGAAYALVGPDVNRGINGGWGRRAVLSDDQIQDWYDAPRAIEAQRRAFGMWRFIGLRQLESRVQALAPTPAREDLLAILGSWLNLKGL